jgi:hypothetical protein
VLFCSRFALRSAARAFQISPASRRSQSGGYSMREADVNLSNSRKLSESIAVFSKRAVGPFPSRSAAQAAADIPSGNLRDVE